MIVFAIQCRPLGRLDGRQCEPSTLAICDLAFTVLTDELSIDINITHCFCTRLC